MFPHGIGVALLPAEMIRTIRIPATLLAAVFALTPIAGALCADGCDAPEPARAVEVAPACGHRDGAERAPVMRAAPCALDDAEAVLAEARAAGPAIAPPTVAPTRSANPPRVRAYERYLRHQPPLPSAAPTLRI